jgi:hypothetical protein
LTMFDSIESPPVNGLTVRKGARSVILIKTDFTKCMDATNDFNSCSYYLEALSELSFFAPPFVCSFLLPPRLRETPGRARLEAPYGPARDALGTAFKGRAHEKVKE